MPVRPSYRGGFAPETGLPRYPELWRGCVFAAAPCLGPSGATLKDLSGRKNHGTLTAMTIGAAWEHAQGAYSLAFDGTDDYVTASNPLSDASTAYSASAWVNTDINTGTGVAMSQRSTSAVNPILFQLDRSTTSYRFLVRNDAGTLLSASAASSVTIGSWTHLCGVRDGNNAYLFVNGLDAATTSGAVGTVTTDSFNIGAAAVGSTTRLSLWDGKLDDLRIYNRALSAAEVRLLSRYRGIAYEPEPRRYGKAAAAAAYKAYWARYNQLLGAGPR